MNHHETPYLTAEHPSLITGGVNQNWALARGFTAFVHIHGSGSCSVGVHAPHVWDHLVFEAKRVLPFLEGFEVEIEPCIDGWNFKIKEDVLLSFIKRLDEIIEQRAYNNGS